MSDFTYLRKIKIKAKYSHPLRLVFDALSKIGLRVTPYYLVLEGLFGETIAAFEKPLAGYDIGYLNDTDMPAIESMPGRHISLEALRERLAKGQRCFGAKFNGTPVAFNWFDFEQFKFDRHRFKLKKNEVCLYDMYTNMDFRGKGLAPYIRYHSYKVLERMGYSRIYSVSDYFNTPSLRFKKKLKAKLIELRLVITFFKRWPCQYLLKTYPE
jgi:phosphoenolpyruvate synthase/pyruvate phosphate dikinase